MDESVISRQRVHYGPANHPWAPAGLKTYRGVSYDVDPDWGLVMVELRDEEVTGEIVWLRNEQTGARRCEYRAL